MYQNSILYISASEKMQAQKGRTKSALLIWTKSDLSDKVLKQVLYNIAMIWYWVFPIWSDLPDLVRFGNWSDRQQSPRRRGRQLLATMHGVGRHTQVSQVATSEGLHRVDTSTQAPPSCR